MRRLRKPTWRQNPIAASGHSKQVHGDFAAGSIGDAVNVAARVEQLTKATGDGILLTQQTVEALASRPQGLEDRGSHELKGKSAAVRVFAVDLQHRRLHAL